MDEPFKSLLETKDLWIPALTALLARFSATKTGHSIERTIKDRLKWLKAPESEKAFVQAFEEGVEKYSATRGHLPEARAAARILSESIRDDASPLNLPSLLEQIKTGKTDPSVLLKLASTRAIELEDALAPADKIAAELRTLVEQFLHTAFLGNPHFTQQIGFSELISLLKDLREELATPQPDLERLRREYLAKVAEKHDVIPMQGISPKVQNRTIGMRMEDIFIPLELIQDRPPQPIEDLTDYLSFQRASLKEALASVSLSDVAAFSGLASEVKLRASRRTIFLNALKHLNPNSLETSLTRETLKAMIESTPKIAKSSKIESLLASSRIVVKGDPGSGKSTLTRYIAWALAKGRTAVLGSGALGRLPLLLRAIEFGEALEQNKVGSLEEYLLAEAGRFAPLIKQTLISGTGLILIDGLDEVGKPALRTRVKERTDDFIADPVFAANQILVTTRIVGYERTGLTGRFQHFTITDLTNDQIQSFVLNWYSAIERETPGSIDANNESLQLSAAIRANESILKMARNPLLLTIIALIKWQGRTLPEQRVLLYDAAAQTLIKSWPLTQRRVEFDELFIREWLAPVALHILADRTGDLIDEYSLMTELSQVMQQLRSMTEIQAKCATRELLDNISEHSGFLLPRDTDKDGNNLYGFLHQTFAEYLAAYYLVGRWEDEDLDLSRYAHDPYWREVFLLMAGHLGTQRRAKAGKFIEAVRTLNSSQYEQLVHRDLLLACQILTDGTPAGPASVIECLLLDVLKLWKQTELPSLKKDIENTFIKLRETEYAEVLARLAASCELQPAQTIALSKSLGARLLASQLIPLLSEAEPQVSIEAAETLLEVNQEISTNTALRLATNKNDFVRVASVNLLLEARDARVVPFLLELLKGGQQSAWKILSVSKPPKGPIIPAAVATLLAAEDYDCRARAAILLANWHDLQGVRALIDIIDSDPKTVPWTFFDADLESFDTESLHQLLRSTNSWIQLFVGIELAERKDPRGVEALLQSDRADQDAASLAASSSLARSKMPEAIAALRERLNSANPKKRLYAAKALSSTGDEAGVEVLSSYLSSDDPDVRIIALEGLMGRRKLDLPSHIDWILASNYIHAQLKAIGLLGTTTSRAALTTLRAAQILGSRNEPEAVLAMKNHIPEFTKGLDELKPVTAPAIHALALADSAYEFVKRHLGPNGELRSFSA
jgi:HEAT repeat protein